MKTALLIGATGLVGSHILKNLADHPDYGRIVVFTRRSTGFSHQKLDENIVNFDNLNEWQKKLKGDVLYSALGTTLKKAGSKDAQYKIDYTYQYSVARAALENGTMQYGLVSSAGADPDSIIFYSRMKGELDRDIAALEFNKIVIVRPSGLMGERKEERPAEKIGIGMSKVLKYLPYLNKYRPIHGNTVARALINSMENEENKGLNIFSLDTLFRLAEGK